MRIVLVIAGAIFTQYFGGRAIDRAMTRLASADLIPGPTNTLARQKERARTTGMVLSSTLNAIIWVLAIAMVLGEFGFNLGPIIASAGVIGVALGLGAQTLVRDILSGIFMLIEDQYGVGDKVDVLDVKGSVEKVGHGLSPVGGRCGVGRSASCQQQCTRRAKWIGTLKSLNLLEPQSFPS